VDEDAALSLVLDHTSTTLCEAAIAVSLMEPAMTPQCAASKLCVLDAKHMCSYAVALASAGAMQAVEDWVLAS
jgi:hypothetical protein